MKPIQTIRLSPRDRRRVMDEINSRSRAVPAQMDRRSMRVDYNVGQVVVTVVHPNRHASAYSVVPRNLSRRGLAVVHGQYVYVGSPCQIMMPRRDGRWVNLEGKVVACRHLGGLMHEVSMAFAKPIDLAQFVELSEDQQKRVEREIAGKVTDTGLDAGGDRVRHVLIAMEDAAAQQLIGLWLEQSGFVATRCPVAQVERRVMEQGYDLIVVDASTPCGTAGRTIRQLTQAGFKGLILAVSVEDNPSVREQCKGAGAFLEMPFTREALQEAVAGLASHRDAGADEGAAGAGTAAAQPQAEPLYSTLAADAQMQPLLNEFVTGLSQFVKGLQNAARSPDLDTLRALCLKLKGTGAGYGFEPITQAARLAIASLDAEHADVAAVKAKVDELVTLLQRAKVA